MDENLNKYLEDIIIIYKARTILFKLDNEHKPISKTYQKGKVVFLNKDYKIKLYNGHTYEITGWVTNSPNNKYEIFTPEKVIDLKY